MLTRLTSNQIANHWEEIKTHIIETVAPFVKVTPMILNNIFEEMIAGNAQVWISWKWSENNHPNIYAMATTCVQVDPFSHTRNLLIYSLSGYRFIPEDLWKEGIEGLRKFAVDRKCNKILAYSSVNRVIDVAKELGGKTDVRYLEWRLD